MFKRAVILAGGKGTRLRPYTIVLPKPLMPIGDYPIVEILIRQLVFFGFEHITLAVNHQAELIKAFFGNGKRFNAKVDYSLEEKPLSTMGPLTLIKDLPENFLVLNGDILTDLNFRNFYNVHIENGSGFTIAAYKRKVVTDLGILETNNNNELVGFREKPLLSFEVSMGIYMVSSTILEVIPRNSAYGFDELMLKLIQQGRYPSVYPFRGYWLDIGRPDDYMKALEEFNDIKDRLNFSCV